MGLDTLNGRVNIALRPVTLDDRLFIESLYFETQRPIIEELFGWRGDDFERQRFAEWYDAANTAIITVDDQRAGWLTVSRRPDAIHLDQIYVSMVWQNHGIGSFLIRQLIEEAQATKAPLKLSTAKINPARSLYERLGFRVVGESGFKVCMERATALALEIRRPSHKLVPSFMRMRDAHLAIGENEWNIRGEEIAHTDPHAYVELMNERARGANIAEGFVRADEFWIVGSSEVVGSLSVRHELTEQLRGLGGHVGYATHPAHRRRGIATFALQSGLKILGRLGIAEALVTSRADNIASIGVIEKCGGRRIEDAVFPGRPELTRRRYVFPLKSVKCERAR